MAVAQSIKQLKAARREIDAQIVEASTLDFLGRFLDAARSDDLAAFKVLMDEQRELALCLASGLSQHIGSIVEQPDP